MKIISFLLALMTVFTLALPTFGAETTSENSAVTFVRPQTADTPEEVLELYFEMLYRGYAAKKPVDISPIIDLDFEIMENIQNWHDFLAMRRRIIAEEGYCYVETERKPYTINYIKKRQLNDQRMDYVNMKDYGKGATALHFIITGEPGWGYPPIFAVNSEHSVVFTLSDGQYKIAYHYFPGSEGKFENDFPVTVPAEEEYRELLAKEFGENTRPSVYKTPIGRIYDPEEAVAYAKKYCESRNKAFHFVGDWYGNCMNFASQCVWSGFRTEGDTPKNTGGMTKKWYCKKNGGTLVWAGVNSFWDWIDDWDCEMQTTVFKHIPAARNGDIVNIGSYAREEVKYSHALIVVDEEKLLLAQNSPACFVYYSDLVNSYSRFIRPISLDS